MFLNMYGIKNIADIGETRESVKECMQNTWVDRLDSIGEENSDFTKETFWCFYGNTYYINYII